MLGTSARLRQVVDWRAAIWAGIISGLVALVAEMLLTLVLLDSLWVVPRIIASLVLGHGVLPPPASFHIGLVLLALLLTLVLSILAACLLAIIVHRWGLIVGVLGGALFGLALYAIAFYGLALLIPWLAPYQSWPIAVALVLYGAMAGGVYEGLEVERFVSDQP